MIMKRSWILALAILGCLVFAWATGAGRPYPATAGGVIDPTCTSSLPCIEYDNNGAGPGIRGVSLTGNGSNGITKVNSTSATNGREGVFGNDMSTSGSFNSGVRGLSVRGNGVLGNSTNGIGVQGISTKWVGMNAVGGARPLSDYIPALSVVGNASGGTLISACATTNPCGYFEGVFSVFGDGSIIDSGNITAFGYVFSQELTVGGGGIPAVGSVQITGQYLKTIPVLPVVRRQLLR